MRPANRAAHAYTQRRETAIRYQSSLLYTQRSAPIVSALLNCCTAAEEGSVEVLQLKQGECAGVGPHDEICGGAVVVKERGRN